MTTTTKPRGLPAKIVANHLRAAMRQGASYKDVEARTGVCERTIRYVLSAPPERVVYRRTASRLMSLPLMPASRRVVSGAGTRRRIEALALLGWTRAEIADRAGLSKSTLRPVNMRRKVYASTASAVARVYNELRMTPRTGWQAERIIKLSRELGYVPGWAWRQGDLDSELAQPNLGLVEDSAWRNAIKNRIYPI